MVGKATMLPGREAIEAAAKLVYRTMPPTPQYTWPQINLAAGREVLIKHENHTPLGAFKVRGGLVYVDALRREQPELRTVVTPTRGNHGQSIALAGSRCGLRVVIVVPHGNSVEKNAAMRALGAELIECGSDFQAAVEEAARLAKENGWHLISSFDQRLVTGVATYAMEFLQNVPVLDTVYVPVGMGSGICGMIAARDALGLPTLIVGVVSTGAPAMALSFAKGSVVEHTAETRVADGVACRLPNADALATVRAGAERLVEVSDDAVEAAMRLLFRATHNVAEGAGAIGLAALLQDGARGGDRVGTVLCGGNVDSAVFARVLADGMVEAPSSTAPKR